MSDGARRSNGYRTFCSNFTNGSMLSAVPRKRVFALPFSQEVMADVLGLSVPHLNRMMQRLRGEKLIAGSERRVEFVDPGAVQALAQYQPQNITPIPTPVPV